MRSFSIVVTALFGIALGASWLGCENRSGDKGNEKQLQEVRSDEGTERWIPPRGMPDGGHVPAITPSREYADRKEYEKAQAWLQRRLLELGRRSPKTEEELRVMMHRCRETPEELGYRKVDEGIKTGSVLVCGLFLPPPYRLSCEPEQGREYTRYKLVVNGVTLSSTLPYDDCGWPYEVLESPLMKVSGCDKKIHEVMKKMEEESGSMTEKTTREKFLAAVKRWEKMLREIECEEPGEVFEVESVRVDEEVQRARFSVTGGFAFPVFNAKDPKLIARNRKRFKKLTSEEYTEQSLKSCKMYKKYVEKRLSWGWIVVNGVAPQALLPRNREALLSILKTTYPSLIEKRRKIRRYVWESPECLLKDELR